MGTMIPDQALNVPKYSREDEMFHALKEHLPEDYYVFYSFHLVSAEGKKIEESETDFVIFCPHKGIMCIEAKNGRIKAKERVWYYSSGKKIWGGAGPFEQASKEKWDIYNLFVDNNRQDIINNCKFLHAVWLPSFSKKDIENNAINYPSEVDRDLTLTSDALVDPKTYIDKIFSLDVQNEGIKTKLDEEQINYILYEVLCPKFDIVPSLKSDIDLNNAIFNHLLDEQKHILDYLEEQNDAVINGVAGSGKTLIAVEKAKRCSTEGKTLFLCFNRYLADFLRKNKKNPNVEYNTIDGFVYSLSQSEDKEDTPPDINAYKTAVKLLSDSYLEESFPYKNIIIDEGQDFGQDRIEKSKIIETLRTIILSEEINGCFYIFYDKLQFVQGKKIPEYIINADCRMSLYKNCRNTENIAITSLRPFSEIRKPQTGDMVVKGESTQLFVASSTEECYRVIEQCVNDCLSNKIDDIVVLTGAAKIEDSLLNQFVSGNKITVGGKKYLFTTCRKFKGLEADVVILTDISFSMMNSDDINLFYVGCSRAKNRLYMLSIMNDEQLKEVYRAIKNKKPSNNVKKSFATLLNAKYMQPSIEE